MTGRTHQFRAHLAHIGTPIVGDIKYGGMPAKGLGELEDRLHLHARSIDIAHPEGGRLHAVATLPPHMMHAWELFGFDPDDSPIRSRSCAGSMAVSRNRFYKEVSVDTADGLHRVLLDGKPVKTPGGAVLALPSSALAQAIADEWRAQDTTIQPQTMLLTKLANTAIDRVAPNPARRTRATSRHRKSDVVCYRADIAVRPRAPAGAHMGPAHRLGRASISALSLRARNGLSSSSSRTGLR